VGGLSAICQMRHFSLCPERMDGETSIAGCFQFAPGSGNLAPLFFLRFFLFCTVCDITIPRRRPCLHSPSRERLALLPTVRQRRWRKTVDSHPASQAVRWGGLVSQRPAAVPGTAAPPLGPVIAGFCRRGGRAMRSCCRIRDGETEMLTVGGGMWDAGLGEDGSEVLANRATCEMQIECDHDIPSSGAIAPDQGWVSHARYAEKRDAVALRLTSVHKMGQGSSLTCCTNGTAHSPCCRAHRSIPLQSRPPLRNSPCLTSTAIHPSSPPCIHPEGPFEVRRHCANPSVRRSLRPCRLPFRRRRSMCGGWVDGLSDKASPADVRQGGDKHEEGEASLDRTSGGEGGLVSILVFAN